jgi:hypothetical protein
MSRVPGGRERGTATAELAVVLPAVVLLAALGVWSVLVGAAQLRCTDAAGVGVRALARGEPAADVRRVVGEVAPRGARVQLGTDGDLVAVEVRVLVPLPGPWGADGPGVEVGDRAVAVDESAGAAAGPRVPP